MNKRMFVKTKDGIVYEVLTILANGDYQVKGKQHIHKLNKNLVEKIADTKEVLINE